MQFEKPSHCSPIQSQGVRRAEETVLFGKCFSGENVSLHCLKIDMPLFENNEFLIRVICSLMIHVGNSHQM